MTLQQDASPRRREGAARRNAAVWDGLFWLAILVLALLTAGVLLADAGGAELNVAAIALAVAALPLGLLLRRHVGAVVALACGAIQAVWLMPSLMTPSVAVYEVPDGASRIASIDRTVAVQTSGHGLASAVDPALGWPQVTPTRADGAAPLLSNAILHQVPARDADAGISAVPAEPDTPADVFAIRVRSDGSIVIDWFGLTWDTDEVPELLIGHVPVPQRI